MNDTITIMVPTYNRASYLEQCLASILVSSDDQIEVIVSDNASPDDTRDVVSRFCDSRVRYYRNDENVGMSRNILKLLKLARGAYVFMLTDDDLLNKGALTEVRRIADGWPDVGLILSTLNILDERTGERLDDYVFHNQDQLFSPGQQALTALFRASHVYSRITIRRDLVDIEGFCRFKNGLYPLMYVAGAAMKKAPSFYTTFPLVTHRTNNEIFWNYSVDYMMREKLDIIQELTAEASDEETGRILRAQIISDTRYAFRHSSARSKRAFLRLLARLISIPEVRSSPIFWRNLARHFIGPYSKVFRNRT